MKMTRQGLCAGVDEAGRGPLAGSVVAAAVILDPDCPIAGLADSKALSAEKRSQLSPEIRKTALAWSIGEADVREIDRLNILKATFLAMMRAIDGLSLKPSLCLIDGNQCPPVGIPCEAIVKGDQKVAAISAASILAKVWRDEQMLALDREYPQYGFARHKGYPTKAHREALKQFGPSAVHRYSFAPVKSAARDNEFRRPYKLSSEEFDR